MKKTVNYLCIVLASVLFAACAGNFIMPERPEPAAPEFIPVEDIIGIPTGSLPYLEINLSGTVMPANANNKRITWSIAADGGTKSVLERNKLTANDYGTVTVSALIKNGSGENKDYTQTFDIEISSRMIAVTSITGIPASIDMGLGQYTLNGRVSPSNALNKTIEWSVKDAGTTGAAIYGNILTTTSSGTAVITASVANGALGSDYTQDFTMVIVIPVTSITGIPSNILVGDYTLNGVVVPSNATNQNITWSIKDAGITGATLNGHTLTTTAEGAVILTAVIAKGLLNGNYTQEFTVNIVAAIVEVTGITGIPSTVPAGNYVLHGVVEPPDATNKTITWAITNAGTTNAIITGSGDTLTTTAEGTVTLTATVVNGLENGDYTQEFTITIIPHKYVYVAGTYEDNNSPKACYWKDGVFHDLHATVPAGAADSYAFDIAAANNTIYIAGSYRDSEYVEYACYWVNGVRVDLPKTGVMNTSFSIAVEGTTIYIIGYDNDGINTPCYWKVEGSGTPQQTIFAGKDPSATAEVFNFSGIFAVNNGVLYIPVQYYWTVDGTWDDEQSKNYLWKGNATFEEIDSDRIVTAITVMNNTVYMAGNLQEDGKLCYWTEGSGGYTVLTGGDSCTIYSIVNQNGALWFYGRDWGELNLACYWDAAGTKTDLPPLANDYIYKTDAVAFSEGRVYIGYGDQYGGQGYKVLNENSYTHLSSPNVTGEIYFYGGIVVQ